MFRSPVKIAYYISTTGKIHALGLASLGPPSNQKPADTEREEARGSRTIKNKEAQAGSTTISLSSFHRHLGFVREMQSSLWGREWEWRFQPGSSDCCRKCMRLYIGCRYPRFLALSTSISIIPPNSTTPPPSLLTILILVNQEPVYTHSFGSKTLLDGA